jgi:acetyl esterase/lipase
LLPETATNIVLTSYARPFPGPILPRGDRWAVLILPGGGYMLTAEREGEPVALAFLQAGCQAFVLDYSVMPACYPQALLEASAAVAFLRANAARYGISKIAVCGFSAGGHLAGCLANSWSDPVLTEPLGLPAGSNRPDAVILSYPVITGLPPYGNGLSFENLLGAEPTEEAVRKLSLETGVSKRNPPAFLWHTCTDGTVPVEHTMLYAGALRAAGVPFELHLYPEGPHAMSLAVRDTSRGGDSVNEHVATWFGLCVQWLNGLK